MLGIIYHIFNTVNGKAYVGQTWDGLEARWSDHRLTTSGCVLLRRAIQKYGTAVFVKTILTEDLVTQEQMDAAEVYWIEYFDCRRNGYNLREGGSHGKLSVETKAKMSEAKVGHEVSADTREKLSAAGIGRKNSIASRLKVSETLKGHTPSEATLSAAIAANTGRVPSYASRVKCARSHGGRSFKDQNGTVYETVNGAAKLLGLYPSNVWKVLNGRYRSTGGMVFRYIIDEQQLKEES